MLFNVSYIMCEINGEILTWYLNHLGKYEYKQLFKVFAS